MGQHGEGAPWAAHPSVNLRFKSVILGVIIATSMFPGISVVVPLLRFFTDLGWLNTYQAMIIPNLSFAIPLAVWNLTTFMKQLPFDLEEAAMIDGWWARSTWNRPAPPATPAPTRCTRRSPSPS